MQKYLDGKFKSCIFAYINHTVIHLTLTDMKLYHGTIIDNKDEILTNGLKASVGAFVSENYRNANPYVFLCDESFINKAMSAIMFNIAKKLNLVMWTRVTLEQIKEHGALFVVEKTDDIKYRDPKSNSFFPESIELNDYYTDKDVRVVRCIEGEELLEIAKKDLKEFYEQIEKSKKSTSAFGGL